MNSEIFINEEAENYFERNKAHSHSYFIDYLLEIFPKIRLKNFDVAEFGIGNGQNLMYLKHFVNKVHGFEGSNSAVELFKKQYSGHPHIKDFFAEQVNLAKPFNAPSVYDLIIYGFFPYYVDDDEMKIVKQNTLKMLKDESYIFIYDFLVRNNRVKTDSRNDKLKVYKRNLLYWLDYFHEFDMIDYRLFDSYKGQENLTSNSIMKIDPLLPADDDAWLFAALFKKK